MSNQKQNIIDWLRDNQKPFFVVSVVGDKSSVFSFEKTDEQTIDDAVEAFSRCYDKYCVGGLRYKIDARGTSNGKNWITQEFTKEGGNYTPNPQHEPMIHGTPPNVWDLIRECESLKSEVRFLKYQQDIDSKIAGIKEAESPKIDFNSLIGQVVKGLEHVAQISKSATVSAVGNASTPPVQRPAQRPVQEGNLSREEIQIAKSLEAINGKLPDGMTLASVLNKLANTEPEALQMGINML